MKRIHRGLEKSGIKWGWSFHLSLVLTPKEEATMPESCIYTRKELSIRYH